ncbi:protein MALE DISCOVERER 2-like [Senna tora]|uniref:Protein MALE DISCOVERER 2-like n=1 Tax=Senna tora TaxID=362788 RepID=A0A834WVE5_9FABA|nr:protein MALE DISCOVERER 2-like [Senna tora]
MANWKPNDPNPCVWFGVQCVEDKVQMLNLSGLSLAGTLAPELGKLTHLKSRWEVPLPRALRAIYQHEESTNPHFIKLEPHQNLVLLVLQQNQQNLYRVPLSLHNLGLLSEQLFVDNSTSHITTEIGCMNRKFGHCFSCKRCAVENKIQCVADQFQTMEHGRVASHSNSRNNCKMS